MKDPDVIGQYRNISRHDYVTRPVVSPLVEIDVLIILKRTFRQLRLHIPISRSHETGQFAW